MATMRPSIPAIRKVRVAGHQAPVDMTKSPGFEDPSWSEVFKETTAPAKRSGPGLMDRIKSGVGRALGNRPSTPAEEQHYKNMGSNAFYEEKLRRNSAKRP